MIIEKKKYGFKSIYCILEDCNKIEDLKKKYSRISIYDYKKLRLNGFSVRSKKTPLVYLDDNLDNIFGKFNATTRKKIRRFEKGDNLKILVEDNNFDEAYKLYKKHNYAYGGVPESRGDLKDLLLFSVYFKNKIIVAIFCYDSPRFLRAKIICSKVVNKNNREELKIIANANCALVWNIVQYAKIKQKKSFDLGSINVTDKARSGAMQFKMGFAPKIVDEYYHIYKSPVYDYFEKLIVLKIFFFRTVNKIKAYVKK